MTEWHIDKILKDSVKQDDVVYNQLQDTQEQAMWLQVALDEYSKNGDFNAFYTSLEKVIEIRKISVRKMSKDLELSRSNIIKLLDGTTKTAPRLDTLTKILDYLDFEITIMPKKAV